jgi:GTP-binding protein HflX
LDSNQAEFLRLGASNMEHTVAVSALNGDGLSDLVARVEDALADLLVSIEVLIPYAKGDELNTLHEQGNVELVDYQEKGTYVRALVPQAIANRLVQYNVMETADVEVEVEAKEEDEIDWTSVGRGRHYASVE